MPRAIIALALFVLSPAAALAATHTHTTSDGHETALCTCRLATAAEAQDLAASPDGWMQDEPRASSTTGEVPYALFPDWVGTRTRAIGTLAFGDADGDGDQDLFVGTYWANQFPPLVDYYNFLYLNNGGVLEAEPSWISSDQRHTTDAKWTTINGDTLPDLFVANGGESLQPSQVFYGQAGPLPTTAGWTGVSGYWAVGCAVADFDEDGDVDVAVANQGNSADPYRPTTLYRNSGTSLQTSPSWNSNQIGITNSASWGDIDGDGDLDLAVAGWSGWQTGVFENTGTTLTTGFYWTTGVPSRTDKGIGWAYVNGDTLADLAVGGNGGVDWLFEGIGTTLGATPVWSSTESYHGCQELQWADVDQDGDPDLATINFGNGHTRIYLNNGGSLSTVADWLFDDSSSGTALAFGDINDDGYPDLAVGPANGPVKVFMNAGAPVGVEETARDLPGPGVVRMVASPNPFSSRVTVTLQAASPFAVHEVALYDVAGRRVAGMTPADGAAARTRTIAWDVAGARELPAGVYFVRASLGDGRVAGARVVRLGR